MSGSALARPGGAQLASLGHEAVTHCPIPLFSAYPSDDPVEHLLCWGLREQATALSQEPWFWWVEKGNPEKDPWWGPGQGIGVSQWE